MEIIKTNKGGQKIILDGYMYTKKSTSNSHIWWTCVRRNDHCKGSLKTSVTMDDYVKGNEHNHDPRDTTVTVVKLKVQLKELAKNTREKPALLVAQALENIPACSRIEFGKEDAVKKMIRRARAGRYPPVPDDLEDLEINGEWAETAGDNPEQFLIYDSDRNADNRILVFASPSALRLLVAAETWFIDGNFAMAPRGFSQLYVIRVALGSTAVSVVYALLQNKSQQCYIDFFQAVMDYCAEKELFPSPATVMCDFEKAVIRAVEIVLGADVRIQGCFYHLTQATWRKIQELGLTAKYKTDEDFRIFCGEVDGLAFLPVDEVKEGMEHLKRRIPDGAQELVNYFDKTYVNGTYRRAQPAHGQEGIRIQHVPPRYPPQIWNVHQATIIAEPRTNNQCEGWNNRFFYLVGFKHPSIWTLIDALKK